MSRSPLYLNGLRAFEASARLGGFAAAAAELNIAPSAVSRMVALLERRIGAALFERQANRLKITPAGAQYQAGLTPLFDAMATLTDQVSGRSQDRILTIGVGPTFAVRWLIPRLAGFQAMQPEADVRITTGGAAAPFGDDWTCGIKLGPNQADDVDADFVSDPLFSADLTPVASPAVAATLTKPTDLDPKRLISVAHAPKDWPMWFDGAAVKGIRPSGPTFAYYGQAIQAAADGIGVALGIRPYIDDDLLAGRLCTPFDVTVAKGQEWRLIFRQPALQNAVFASFRQWLLAEAYK